jgi:WD40 repeat protein
MPFAFLTNDDIFISYSRRDSACARYARNLYDELMKRGFSPFMDRLGTEPSPIQPESLNRKIRNSKMLILVGTERACQSEFVEREIKEFVESRRFPIVPIDFGGTIPNARWYSLIEGVTLELETREALESGIPSADVIKRMEEAFKYTKRNHQLRKATRITVGVLLTLILLSIGAAIFAGRQMKEAGQARVAALDASNAATTAKQKADVVIKKAAVDVSDAELKTENAERDRIDAVGKTKQAETQQRLAEAKTRTANEEARKASAATKRQRELNSAMQLANKSQQIFKRQPDNLPQSVAYGLDSMKIVTALGVHSLESDNALRESLALLPAYYNGHVYEDDYALNSSLSPDAGYLAILTDKKTLNIFRTLDQQLIKTISRQDLPADPLRPAVNSDARYLAVASYRVIKLYDLQKSSSKEFHVSRESVTIGEIALSPDGRYLACLLYNDQDDGHIRSVGLWETGDEQRMLQFGVDNMPINSIGFSPDGDTLAVGGQTPTTTASPRDIGLAVFWSGLLSRSSERLTEEMFAVPQTQVHDSEIMAIAVGMNNTYATISRDSATVWKLDDAAGGPTPIARMPRANDLKTVAFNANGARLSIVREVSRRGSDNLAHVDLQVWDSIGYPYVSEALLSSEIEAIAFGPDNNSILAKTSSVSGVSGVEVWQANNGREIETAGLSLASGEPLFQSRDLRYVVSTENGGLFVWDGWHSVKVPVQHDAGRQCVSATLATMTTNGSFLVLICQGKTEHQNLALIYQLVGGAYVNKQLLLLGNKASGVELTADGESLITRDADFTVHIWDVTKKKERTPEAIKQLKDVDAILLSPTGAYLVTKFSFNEKVSVWRVRDGYKIRDYQRADNYCFSSRDHYFLSSGDSNEITLLDLSKGSLASLRIASVRFDTSVCAVAFSANEQYFAAGTTDGGVSVFATDTNTTELIRLQLDGVVKAIAFDRANHYLATAIKRPDPHNATMFDECSLQVWLLQPKSLMDEATRRISALAKAK